MRTRIIASALGAAVLLATIYVATLVAQGFPPQAQTVGTTPTTFGGFGPQLQPDEVCRGTVFIFATNHDTGQKYWEYRVVLRRLPSGANQQAIFTAIVNGSGTAASSTWTAVPSLAPDNGEVVVTVTGSAGQTVHWGATSDSVLCMFGDVIRP